jgi:hypothetical protein
MIFTKYARNDDYLSELFELSVSMHTTLNQMETERQENPKCHPKFLSNKKE